MVFQGFRLRHGKCYLGQELAGVIGLMDKVIMSTIPTTWAVFLVLRSLEMAAYINSFHPSTVPPICVIMCRVVQ